MIDEYLDRNIAHFHYPDHARYVLKGGKRIRGTLCLLVSQALGGRVGDTLPYASSIEMVHAATLVHDDFIDEHEVRHGMAPLYKVLGPRKAILLADMLLSRAAYRVTALGGDGYRTLTEGIYDACRGAVSEPLASITLSRNARSESILKLLTTARLKNCDTEDIPRRLYPLVIRLKTAGLFGTACKLGAMAANAPQTDRKRAYGYGIAVGEAYQIADDIVDIKVARRTGRIDRATKIKLFPMTLCFSPPDEPINKASAWISSDALPRIRISDMERMINARIQRARDIARKFPSGEYQRLLNGGARVVVDLMLNEGPSLSKKKTNGSLPDPSLSS